MQLPNGIGCFLGAMQLVLYMIYMNTKASKHLGDSSEALQRQRLIEHDEEGGLLA